MILETARSRHCSRGVSSKLATGQFPGRQRETVTREPGDLPVSNMFVDDGKVLNLLVEDFFYK